MQRLLPKRKKVQPDIPRAELPLLATFGLFVCWFFWLLSHSSNFKCSLIGVPIFMAASRPCIPFLKWLRNGKHLVIALLSLYGKQSRPPLTKCEHYPSHAWTSCHPGNRWQTLTYYGRQLHMIQCTYMCLYCFILLKHLDSSGIFLSNYSL